MPWFLRPDRALPEHGSDSVTLRTRNRGINVGDVDGPRKIDGPQGSNGEPTGGIEYLFKKNKVDYFKGVGTITGPQGHLKWLRRLVDVLPTKNVLIATIDNAIPWRSCEIDEETIVSSTACRRSRRFPRDGANLRWRHRP